MDVKMGFGWKGNGYGYVYAAVLRRNGAGRIMRFPKVAASVAAALHLAAAQSANTAADRPSNGVVEMAVTPVLAPETQPPFHRGEVYGPWTGLVVIKIRNISKRVITLEEIDPPTEFDVTVLGVDGKSAPLTLQGRRDDLYAGQFPMVSVHLVELVPLAEATVRMNISRRFEIRPGQPYRVTLKRSKGLPKVGDDGNPLKDAAISVSFEVPEYGILR
jgi:hypothetical protein